MRGDDLIVVNAAVWARPDAEVIEDRVVIVRGGRIDAVHSMSDATSLPPAIPVLDADGRIITAGFWNCHVHLTEPVWANAARSDPAVLQRAADDMLVSRGFTSVVDLASNSRDTLPLITRIESGELSGPSIRTATDAIFPACGLPFYTKESVPWFLW